MSDSDFIELALMERDKTLNPRQLRTAGFCPGTIYSAGVDSKCVQMKSRELERALATGKRNFKFVGMGDDLFGRMAQFQLDPISQALLNFEIKEISAARANENAEERKLALEEAEKDRLEQEAQIAADAKARNAAEAEAAAAAEAAGPAVPPAEPAGV